MEGVTKLLERERELQELRSALIEAQQERGQLLLIEGQAGLGKTSLLREAVEAATQSGFTCLRARASELECDFPYGSMRQLIEPTLIRATPAERDRLFEGAAAFSLPLFARSGPSRAEPSANGTFSVLHGLYWLLNNLTRAGPLALCVDDLHWSDTESLQFLNYLAPRLDGLALAVIACTRSRENPTAELARLRAGPETKVLKLEPLSTAGSTRLCENRLGTKVAPDFAAACHGATGGNPFFLEMLLREARELNFLTDTHEAARVHRFGPAAVARAVLLRLSTAAGAATALVRATAVLGDGATVAEAARLIEIPEDEAAHTADLLVTLSILKQGECLEFAHPIVRQAVYADIGSHERARMHARAAQMLADRGASDERIATQIAHAEPIGDASRVGLLRLVAANALTQGAPVAAVTWLRRALAEPPPLTWRPEVLLELGVAEQRLAMPEAVDHLTAAMKGIKQPQLLSTAARELANALSARGDAERAIAVIESAIASVEREEPEIALILEAEFAAKAQQASRAARTRATVLLARHSHLAGITPGERLVLAGLAFEQARSSESASDAVRIIERALAAGGFSDPQQPDVVGPFYALVIGLLGTDALDLAAWHLEQALADARARASIPAIAWLTVHRGWFSLRGGAVAEAEADARTALDLMNAHGIQLGNRFALALLVEALIEERQTEAARLALHESGLGTEIPPGLANNSLLEARGVLRLAEGDTRLGLEDLLEFGRRDEQWSGANPLASRWRSRACIALAAVGNSTQARELATEDLERAQRWGAASGIGVALRAIALVGDSASTIDRLREATEVLEPSPAKLEYAGALTDLGAALRRANRRAEARGALQKGYDLAKSCNAGALLERAGTELRAAGGPSSDATGVGSQRLTVSERRVAELAAKGYSNPKIAQTLFVTRKTIETHLGHIYAKLDISSRAELARALTQENQNARR